jgi:hypothetical protein
MILEARGEKRWLVRFDTGLEKECPSVSLKLLGDPRHALAAVTTVLAPPVLPPTASVAAPGPTPILCVAPALPSMDLQSLPIQIPAPVMPPTAAAPAAATTVPEPPDLPPTASTVSVAAPDPDPMLSMAPTLPPMELKSLPLQIPAPVIPPTAAAPAAATILEPPVLPPTASTGSVAAPDPAPMLTVASDIDDENVDLNEEEEAVQENHDEDNDNGFNVVENVTADVYQQWQFKCKNTKHQLIESIYMVCYTRQYPIGKPFQRILLHWY